METMKRDAVIERLIESRIDTAMSDPFYLFGILSNGNKGFNEMTNEELVREFSYEFDDCIVISNK